MVHGGIAKRLKLSFSTRRANALWLKPGSGAVILNRLFYHWRITHLLKTSQGFNPNTRKPGHCISQELARTARKKLSKTIVSVELPSERGNAIAISVQPGNAGKHGEYPKISGDQNNLQPVEQLTEYFVLNFG